MTSSRRRRLARAGTYGLSGTAALVAAGLGGASWYYANRLVEPPADLWPPAPKREDRCKVLELGDGTLTLTGPGASRPGRWGLIGPNGYAQVGPVEVSEDHRETDWVVRDTKILQGMFARDDAAVLDGYAWPRDPSVMGQPAHDLTFDTPLGPTPAWWFPATRPSRRHAVGNATWAIFVHGRSARRHEAFRIIPTITRLGVDCLTIAYRNDPDAPRSPDGRSHLGDTEWEDLDTAMAWAIDRGARRLLLVGFSMGGAMVVNALRLSEHADRVAATILEAPVLAWGPVLRWAARDRGLPAPVIPLILPTTMALTRARTGIDWERLRHIDRPESFTRPTLLIHGDADETVPVELARTLAKLAPDTVEFEEFAGAGHIRNWNADSVRYEATVRRFIGTHVVR